LIKHHSFDAVIFEDYDKGLITEHLIKAVTQAFSMTGVPVCVDPKKRNFSSYHGVDLFKPNLKEIKEGLKIQVDPKNPDSLREADQKLREVLDHRISLITLSEEGVFVSDSNTQSKIPAHLRTITDVSGAGDTVISVATLCMAAGLDKEVMAEWSNLAGGLTCEKVGVVPVDKDQLIQEILRIS
jgi:D-glycero-beta-D-manno-heptose-7-phosphate kinase